MNLEDALYNHLSAHTGLAALVGDRIYPDDLPLQPVYPAVVFEMDSGERYEAMGKRPGIAYPHYTFYCWALLKSQAVAVAAQVTAALDYFWGTMGTLGALPGLEIQFAKVEDEYDLDPDKLQIGKAATKQYCRVVKVIINHRE